MDIEKIITAFVKVFGEQEEADIEYTLETEQREENA